jgi:translin
MSLARIFEELQSRLKEKDKAREKVLSGARTVGRASGQAILSVHRGDYTDAKRRLREARGILNRIERLIDQHPELGCTGSVITALQEYAEARVFLGIAEKDIVLGPSRICVKPIPYLLGLGDLIGELRRRSLDSIRLGKLEIAERSLELMENIYTNIIALEDVQSSVPGLRRKSDVARHLIETTRGDVTLESRRLSLQRSIQSLEDKMTKHRSLGAA